MENTVVGIQLVNGMNVVGKLEKSDLHFYFIKKPLNVRIDPMMGGLSISPYGAELMEANEEFESIEINKSHVISLIESYKLNKELIKTWEKYEKGELKPEEPQQPTGLIQPDDEGMMQLFTAMQNMQNMQNTGNNSGIIH